MLLNKFISSITLKIIIGAVLSAIIIISLLNLSQELNTYLEKFENGDLLQLGCYILLLATSAAGLFFLLVNKKIKTKTDIADTSIAALLSSDFKILGIKFIEGFISGLVNEANKKNKDNNILLSNKKK